MQRTLLLAILCGLPPSLPIEQRIDRTEQDTSDWNRQRWCEFIAIRRSDKPCQPSPTGRVIDMLDDSNPGCCWAVCYEGGRGEALHTALQNASATGHRPGVWILTREGRPESFTETQVVAEYLRSYGVPIRLSSMPIPEASYWFGTGDDCCQRLSSRITCDAALDERQRERLREAVRLIESVQRELQIPKAE